MLAKVPKCRLTLKNSLGCSCGSPQLLGSGRDEVKIYQIWPVAADRSVSYRIDTVRLEFIYYLFIIRILKNLMS